MKKKIKYEYWPFWLFYAPFTPLWVYYSLKRMDILYFCDANPGMKYGGFVDYSKYNIIRQLPQLCIPKSEYVYPNQNIDFFSNLEFPLVLKPDKGERGKGVEIVYSNIELQDYLVDSSDSILVQEMIDYDYEFGVFFYKMPNDPSNYGITGITGKHFLRYIGDGKSSLGYFIQNNKRAKLNKKYLLTKYENQLDLVLEKGESMVIEKIGNHNRGTTFYDASHLINDKVVEVFKGIADLVSGFNVGRFDVKVKTEKDLETGHFLKVIEINGVNSEATHIYDEKYTLITAYKEVYKHLRLVYAISGQVKRYNNERTIPAFLRSCFKSVGL